MNMQIYADHPDHQATHIRHQSTLIAAVIETQTRLHVTDDVVVVSFTLQRERTVRPGAISAPSRRRGWLEEVDKYVDSAFFVNLFSIGL